MPNGAARWAVPGALVHNAAPGNSFVDACLSAAGRSSMLYFLLNVGDGDAQLIVFPEEAPGHREAVVVDSASTSKLPSLLDALAAKGVLDLEHAAPFPLVVGTHPHRDHIGGIPAFLERFGGKVRQFWEPGYYHPSPSYVETMVALEDHPRIQRLQPTSGTVAQFGPVRLTVLSPGIGLRSRFDSYGTEVNDSSIALKVQFPAVRVTSEVEASNPAHENRVYVKTDPWALILGADAQTTAWAQAVVDFPQLHREHNPVLFRELRMGMGEDALRAQIFKVPHHASKHGLNIELVERIDPMISLVSSVGGAGKYGFPHNLALEAVREARQPTTSSGAQRLEDHELGIHYTAGVIAGAGGQPDDALGSMALMVPPSRRGELRMWRLGDSARQAITAGALDVARELSPLRKPD